MQSIAKHFSFIDDFKELDFIKEELRIIKISYDKNNEPTFFFENILALNFQNCTWRLEKDQEYLVGFLDVNLKQVRTKLNVLIGKKLIRISVSARSKKAKFEFENQYILKTFRCVHTTHQWSFSSNSTVLFQA